MNITQDHNPKLIPIFCWILLFVNSGAGFAITYLEEREIPIALAGALGGGFTIFMIILPFFIISKKNRSKERIRMIYLYAGVLTLIGTLFRISEISRH
jgi:hypothetical protein